MSGHLISKHIKAEDLKYFESGMIRFGSLFDYAAQERIGDLGGRFDGKEGSMDVLVKWTNFVTEDGIEGPGNIAVYPATPGIVYTGSQIRNFPIGNRLIFCTSNGKYDEDRHRSICFGSGDYVGDRRLVKCVEFYKYRLMEAIVDAIYERFPEIRGVHVNSIIRAAAVEYLDQPFQLEIWRKGMEVKHYLEHWEERATFVKSSVYAVEEEHRMTLPFLNGDARYGRELLIQSDKIRSAVRQTYDLSMT